MKHKKIVALAVLSLGALATAQAATITDWDFDLIGTQAAPYNNPSPTTGAGLASVLGMVNSYSNNAGGSLAYADVTAQGGSSTGSGSYAWRIRGGSVAGGAGTPNGWSSLAPIGSQGAEFDVSTVGYTGINVTFDLYFTTQAPAKIELEYTTDGINWVNSSQLTYAATPGYILNNTTSPNTVMGTYFYQTGGQNWYNQLTANLSGVTGVANDSKFGIRVVNAATGADDVNYTGAPYNNSSGNIRFDNVIISGTAVPEPTTLGLAGFGGMAALVALRRLKNRRF